MTQLDLENKLLIMKAHNVFVAFLVVSIVG